MEFTIRKSRLLNRNKCRINWTNKNRFCHFHSSEFPLRFQSGENPSRGIMEIYTNDSWKKLCTRSWDTGDENLTCEAMGYANNGVHDNGTWYSASNNASSTSVRYNCTTLTECGGNIDNNTQLCKGSLV